MLHNNTGPIEPSFDVFVDVIRSMLESPDTAHAGNQRYRHLGAYNRQCEEVAFKLYSSQVKSSSIITCIIYKLLRLKLN